ncbi:MAG: alkaline phosphatase D family protein [Isosphaeraceae bacterium]
MADRNDTPDARPVLNRREFAGVVAAGLAGANATATAAAVLQGEGTRPAITDGVASGDVSATSGVVWGRVDRPSRMVVEWSTTERFADARRVEGPAALPESDHTAKTVLTGLPPGQRVFYRVRFQDLASPKVWSHPASGSFSTAPADRRDVTFAWSGDTAGQGYGIDVSRGGMLTYDSIRKARPDFLLHSGDLIYADNPIAAEMKLDDGTVWKNVTTPAKSKVAETLDEFRGNYRYNLLDEHVRAFNAEFPVIAQWDDHETLNNWYPGEMLDADPRYTVKSVSLLAARAKRAFFEYQATRLHPDDPERIYRTVRYGPLVEVFVVDGRSYRGPNTGNRQASEDPDTPFLGNAQVDWLARRLAASRAVWKIVASDMPVGVVVPDGPIFEAVANGDGPPLGRELETARLLRMIKQANVRNVVWLTADVHYAAAHYYDPAKARFQDFLPFWEFIAGPLHAGTFGPGVLDDTFGPQLRFKAIPDGMKPNRPPSDNFQFFGLVRVDGKTSTLTVSLHNRVGERLYRVELPAEV